MTNSTSTFEPDELISSELTLDRDAIRDILEQALTHTEKFISLATQNKTINPKISFDYLLQWLAQANAEIHTKTDRYLWTSKQAEHRFYVTMPHRGRPKKVDVRKTNFYRLQDIQDALQLVTEVERRSPDLQDKLVVSVSKFPKHPTKNTRRIKHNLEINGVPAVEFEVKKHHNLNDPLVDMSFKVNNPVGRLWRAIKRLWKNQKTIIALRFTIPLLVLPIFVYLGYRIWQGRGVNTPVSKLGIIHQLQLDHQARDVFILPTSDVYLLDYGPAFTKTKRILEEPVILIGTLNSVTNTLTISDLIPYDPELRLPRTPNSSSITAPSGIRQLWDNSWNFFQYFK